ncbi:zinc ribbon domain-containing protein [Eubacterium sp. 1001713B170207_170306_E7]|uniref:zinc ribbon domain-containing protein n=1 Tax=Eubacterium sp. 1001713B170207_170306_E7 TaxID=2787097 RepID=UPI001896B0E2|nr:zinc ribbon domain-containing protein [Eubacterium sp. 1001713B170207_170306_E7]
MTKYCPNCYVGVGPEDKVCSNCGTELKPDEVKMAETFPAQDPGDAADVFAAKIENTSCDMPEEEKPAEIGEEENPADAADVVIASMIDGNSCSEDSGSETAALAPSSSDDYRNAFENEPEDPEAVRPAADVPIAKVMGLGEWLLTLFLVCIPIVNLIMLIYWSAANDIDPNKKNYARAQLIIMAIGVVISFMFFGSIVAMILAFGNYYYY